MPAEIDDKSLDDIIDFLKRIIAINRIFRNSKGIIDCNSILKPFKYEIQNEDSGFESEPISVHNNTCLVSAAAAKEIILQKDNLYLLLEQCLIAICNFIQKTDINTKENQTRIDTVLEFLIEFIKFLEEIVSNVPFREIIQTFLDSIVSTGLADENDTMFNFSMALLTRFGCVQELHECIMDIFIKNLEIFAENINIEGVDASFSFHYETDFSRANTLLLTLLIIRKKYNCSLSSHHDKDICSIMQTFAKLDDFFTLGFLGYNCLLK